MGIGGEYSAITSAIDEMMPARYRGRTDVWINGTYWLRAIIGTFATFLLLGSLRTSAGWRICFLVGPALAFVILFMRRNLSESPQWLMTHGREREAEKAFRRIEEAAIRDGQHLAFLWQYPVQGRLDNWTARRNYPVCGCGRLRWPQPWQGSAA